VNGSKISLPHFERNIILEYQHIRASHELAYSWISIILCTTFFRLASKRMANNQKKVQKMQDKYTKKKEKKEAMNSESLFRPN
jgi:hypothetical protein